MATITWTGAAGDNNFNNPANWSPAQVPTAVDTAIITPAAAAVIGVTNNAVGNLTTNSFVTISVADNDGFTIGGSTASTFTNGGTVTLNSAGNDANLIVAAPTLTLTGGGKILLNNNNDDRFYGASAADVLSNVNNTILGGGQLGAGQLTLVNGTAGIIDADAAAALVVNTGTIAMTNSGLMEATGGVVNYGGLALQTAINDGTSGRITASGGNVYLDGASISGGTLASSGAGAVVVQYGQSGTLSAGTAALVNTGHININDNARLYLNGALANGGTLSVASTGDASGVTLQSNVTLSGSGLISLSDSSHDLISGSASTLLTNNSRITGSGQLGNGAFGLGNGGSGTIDATGTNNRLVINTGTVTATNAGLIEDTGTAGLQIDTAISQSGNGKIEASGANTVVAIDGGTILGGVLQTVGGGLIDVEYGNSGSLNGVSAPVVLEGNLNVNDNATLYIQGGVDNVGTISLLSKGNTSLLEVNAASASLSHAGTITLSDYANNVIEGAAAADVLNNSADTIQGSGRLGNGQMVLANGAAGIIDATGIHNQLIISTGTLTSTNAGLIEATGAAGLVIINSVLQNSSTGTILAAGSDVDLNNSTLLAGTLLSSGTGSVSVNYGQGATLNGASAGAVTNAGRLVVADNGGLTLLGTLVNKGTLLLNSVTNSTNLAIGPGGQSPGTVTLTGSGTLILSDEANNRIYGAIASDELLNLNNTIEGSGQLGANGLVFVNDALVDATGTKHALVVQTGSGAVTNAGTMEATAAAGLVINGATVTNTGSLLATGGDVYLQYADIVGGLVSSAGSYATDIQYGYGATLDGSTHTVTNSGAIDINDNGSLTVFGTLNNTGSLALQSDGNATRLILGPGGSLAATTTLTGGGTVSLSDSGDNYIYGNSSVDSLVNVNNTISGSGQLGNGTLTLSNQSTIDATGTNVALVLSTGGGAVTNTGLMEATGPAGLVIYNTTVSNGTGTVSANGGNVYLQGGDIAGGTLAEAAGSAVVVQYGYGATLDGSATAISTPGAVNINDNGSLTVLGTLVNSGTIALQSTGDATRLIVNSPTLTLTGAGTVALSDNTDNLLYASGAADTLNNVNNTITGAGQLGAGTLTLLNAAGGVIDASGTSSLVVNTGTATTTNAGLMESTSTGGLVLQSVVNNGSTGVISAAGGNVYLQSADIQGGTLTASSDGAIVVQSGEPATLDGTAHAVNVLAPVDINDNGSLTVLGSIVDTGGFNLQANNDYTRLIMGGNVTLSGAGTIALSDGTQNLIYGAAATDVLNNTTNVIAGSGQLGNGQLTLVNGAKGVIDGNGSQNALVLNTGTIATTNSGLIESTSTGGLVIESQVTGSQTGTILAAGGDVYLQGGTVKGGFLESSGGAATVVAYGQSGTLDGSAVSVANYGLVNINDNGSLTILGNIGNRGSIALLSTGDATRLILGGTTTTLSGGGTVTLSNGNDYIYGAAAADLLDNAGDTIIGSGQFGDGQMTLENAATIEAEGGTLNLDLGSTGTNTATGKWLASAGTLSISNGTYSNAGTIEALAGGNIAFSSNATLSNYAAGTLTGGLYGAIGAGSSLTLSGQAVTVDATDIVLSGTGSAFTSNGEALETTLGSITAGGELQVLGGRSYNGAVGTNGTLALTNAGTLALGGGTFDVAGGLVEAAGSVLTGFGTLANSITSTSTVLASGGTLDLAGAHNTLGGTIGGTGTLQFDTGATTISAGSTFDPSSIALINSATLNTSGQTLTVLGDYTNSATGTGNSYKPFAGITGTINGHGTALAIVGVNGTVITDTKGVYSVTIAAGGSAQFVIENTGAAGSAALRGALETTVNGGNITSSALSGSGVTAANFGAIAAGSESGTYTIDYSSGTLTNQAIHFQSDFANVAGLTLDINAGAQAQPPIAKLPQSTESSSLLVVPGTHS